MLFTSYRSHLFILYDATTHCLYFYFYILFLVLFLFYFVVNLMRHICFSAEVHYCCKPPEAQMLFCAEVFIAVKPH